VPVPIAIVAAPIAVPPKAINPLVIDAPKRNRAACLGISYRYRVSSGTADIYIFNNTCTCADVNITCYRGVADINIACCGIEINRPVGDDQP